MAIFKETKNESFHQPSGERANDVKDNASTELPQHVIDGTLFVPRAEGIYDPGWRAKTSFMDAEGQEMVVVGKGDREETIPKSVLEASQAEMNELYRPTRTEMGSAALDKLGVDEPEPTEHVMRHVTIVDAQGDEPPRTIRVRHEE